MKTLHPKILELQRRTAGEYLTCRYVDAKGAPIVKDFQVRATSDDPSIVEAYVAVWGVRDSYGTIAVKGCFAKSIQERGPASGAKNKIIHLFMHDWKEPLGQLVEMVEDDYGLRVKIKFDDVAGTPMRILKQTKSGTINQYSYGFRYIWDKMEYKEDIDAVLMLESDLYETTSVTILASNPETYTIRTADDLNKRMVELGEESEDVIATLPRKQQLEIRQLISQYKALVNVKPETLPEPPEGELVVGSYKLNTKQFK